MNNDARPTRPSALGTVLAAAILISAAASPAPRKWDLRLELKSSGTYQVVSRGLTYDGDFSFTLVWSGTMEEDDQDYRLVQKDVHLLDWRAHETTTAPTIRTPMMTGDFPEKPSFLHFFVLKNKNRLTIEFALQGFSIPVHPSGDKVLLDLPRTAKNSSHESKVDYDAFVNKGANLIQLPAPQNSRESVEREFAWGWKHKQWSLGQDQVVYVSNAHKASVAVFIRPQP